MLIELNTGWSGDNTCTTSIKNKDRSLPGIGRTLWEVGLKYIQKIANEYGLTITHYITKYPHEGLSPAKWDELFVPLLNKHGYSKKTFSNPNLNRLVPNSYEKIYTPQVHTTKKEVR